MGFAVHAAQRHANIHMVHAGLTEAFVTPGMLPVTGMNLAPPMMAPKAVKTPDMQRSQMGTGNGSATSPVL